MTKSSHQTLKPPIKLLELLQQSWAIQLVKTAAELDLFTILARSPRTAAEVAGELKTDARGTMLLLDALVGLEFLKKKGTAGDAASLQNARYELTETAEVYLVSTSRLFMGLYLKRDDELSKMWRSLTEAIRTGEPVMQVNQEQKAQEIFPALAESIFPISYATALDLAEELKIDRMKENPVRVLDIATGSAVWTIPMAQANKNVIVDAVDFPAVLPVAEKFAHMYGVEDRFHFIAGSWQDTGIENNAYDLIVLGHILHSEGLEESKRMLVRCFEALKPGGRIVIAEFFANEDRTGPPQPLMFAVNMYLATTSGCVFSENELREILAGYGFRDIRRIRPDSVLMIAAKPL